METKALKAKRPGFTDERYMETAYFVENGEFLCDAAGITQPFIKIYRISWEPKIFPASVSNRSNFAHYPAAAEFTEAAYILGYQACKLMD